MGHNHLRDDKICENCGYTVDIAYCSNCGQKNIETRQSFIHLVTHFAEDFTHYDGAFWKTIKNLLLRPGKLTNEYLAGKRQKYVPPVKLYIFISFVTFLLMHLMSGSGENHEHGTHTGFIETHDSNDNNEYEDSLQWFGGSYKSVDDLEEKQRALPEEERMGWAEHWLAKKILISMQKDISMNDINTGFMNVLPKVLFIYMPVFAFFLWLFHGKKRWYFFDHGIFTLHYFSFLLFLLSITLIINSVLSLFIKGSTFTDIADFILLAAMLYAIYCFFSAHKRVYKESNTVSILKSLALSVINFILIIIGITVAFLYAYINLH